jgi:methionyl-tRNA formyltransferase
MSENTYLVAGTRPWNRDVFDRRIGGLPGRWEFVDAPGGLTPQRVEELDPRYLFFLHWSSLVPRSITDRYECVNFHMTDVPFGRGGSPLQNLIARGRRDTMLTALRMTADLDAGPVYMKRPLSLEGLAEEIYLRASHLAVEMIEQIIREQPQPEPQQGEPLVFERRRPEQSEIGHTTSLDELFDFLRMLDAEGYPRAFLVHRGYRYEFSRPARRTGHLEAQVIVTRADSDEDARP